MNTRENIVNRVKFLPGLPATRIARACGFPISSYNGNDQSKNRVPEEFQKLLDELVDAGEIQEYRSHLNQEPTYFPKGHSLPKQARSLPQIGDRIPEEFSSTKAKVSKATKQNFEESTERLWQSLDHFRQQGKPFHAIDLIRHAGLTGHSCLDKRPALKVAIAQCIREFGRPPRSSAKQPALVTERSKYSA